MNHDPLLSDNFFKCIFAVPGTADDRTIYFAMVRRNGSSLDDMHDVFPDAPIAWVSLCSFNAAFFFSSDDLGAASWIAADRSRDGIGSPGGQSATKWRREFNSRNYWRSRIHDRHALLRAF